MTKSWSKNMTSWFKGLLCTLGLFEEQNFRILDIQEMKQMNFWNWVKQFLKCPKVYCDNTFDFQFQLISFYAWKFKFLFHGAAALNSSKSFSFRFCERSELRLSKIYLWFTRVILIILCAKIQLISHYYIFLLLETSENWPLLLWRASRFYLFDE